MLDNLPTPRSGSSFYRPADGKVSALLDNLPEPARVLVEPFSVDAWRKTRHDTLTREPRGLRCRGPGACGRSISPHETAYLRPGAAPAIQCRGCAGPRIEESLWQAERPCEWCSRPLSVWKGSRKRLRLFCDCHCQAHF